MLGTELSQPPLEWVFESMTNKLHFIKTKCSECRYYLKYVKQQSFSYFVRFDNN